MRATDVNRFVMVYQKCYDVAAARLRVTGVDSGMFGKDNHFSFPGANEQKRLTGGFQSGL